MKSAAANGTGQYVTFFLGDQRYGAPIQHIRGIVERGEIVRVPGVASYVEGAMNLRGEVIPVANLRRRLRLEQEGTDLVRSRVLLAEAGGVVIGLVVDAVDQVMRIDEEHVAPADSLVSTGAESLITGVARDGDDLVLLVDVVKLAGDPAVRAAAGH